VKPRDEAPADFRKLKPALVTSPHGTGEKGSKTKWSFRIEGAEWFCFAGVWDRAHTADGEIESYALVTLPPSRAFEKYHDRQPLIPQREDYTASLDSPAAAKELFAASRPDRYTTDWSELLIVRDTPPAGGKPVA
jgi:putative SOS response-associated peptidase YedK